jgi:hypothetical protein
MGGVGFTHSADSATPAFLASVAATLPHLRHTPLHNLDSATLAKLPLLGQVSQVLAFLTEHDVKVNGLPSTITEFITKFRKQKHSDGLQALISRHMYTTFTTVKLQNFTKEERCHFTCRQTPLASAALKAHPLTSEFYLNEQETRFMVAHATANKPKEMPSLCSCGQPLDLSHCTHCNHRTVLQRHNRMQARLAALAREQGCYTEQNLRVSIDDAKEQQEPDIIFYFPFGQAVETDVTVVNPTAPTYVAQSAYPGFGEALISAERRKNKRYLDKANLRGRRFLPLAFETTGRVGKGVEKLLQRFANLTDTGTGWAASDMLMDLQVTLVKANAACAQTVAAWAKRTEDKRRGGHFIGRS